MTVDDWRAAGDFDKAAKPGDLVDEEIVQEFVNVLPPTTLRSNLVQAGEPYSHHFDPETERWRCTYTTFAKVDGEWVYCGNCFVGKTEEPPKLPNVYPAYELSNNNANIRRIRQRIAELEAKKENPAEGWEFDGGKVVVNQSMNRLQIVFDDRPDEGLRSELKGEGFRWAPSQGAWQRQLTDNAMRAARRIKAIAPGD